MEYVVVVCGTNETGFATLELAQAFVAEEELNDFPCVIIDPTGEVIYQTPTE